MAKIRIEWTTTVTETHVADVDYEDFADAVRQHGVDDPPSLDGIRAGVHYVSWDDLGAEFEGEAEYAQVDDRSIDSIRIIED